MNRAWLAMLSAGLFLVAGCQSNPDRPAAVLGLDDQGQTITLRQGEEIIIVLRDRSGGAIWTESAENASSSGVVQRVVDPFAPESGKFRYRAIAPGETTIKLQHQRPLDSSTATQPARTVSYHVRVTS